MPANDTYWRNQKGLHKWFAWSCVALLFATLLMLSKDHDDEWREHQEIVADIEAARLNSQLGDERTSSYADRLAELQQAFDEAQAAYENNSEKIEAQVKQLELEVDLAEREVKAQNAEVGVARANYDLSITRGAEDADLKAIFDDHLHRLEELDLAREQVQAKLDAKLEDQSKLAKDRDAAQTELAQFQTEIKRLEAAREKVAPESWFSSVKRDVMEWPIIDGFNSPHKVNQIWLPDLKQHLGMSTPARYDRCTTCHVLIDRVEAGNIPTFPAGHPTGETPQDWVAENLFPQPYSTHSNPDLFLTASSPHPIQEFGCTACHDGQGSGTSFSNASHTPNDPHEEEVWAEKYHYHSNHFWEYPMHPKRFAESSCLKCHHNVTELETSPKFGNSAPKLTDGFHLIERFGCFGCHEINGYEGDERIGPDLRIEPNFYAIAEQIGFDVATRTGDAENLTLSRIAELAHHVADDPAGADSERRQLQTLVIADKNRAKPLLSRESHKIAADLKDVEHPGKYRKVGPSLRHIGTKTTRDWITYWTEEPKRFRPTTRMPQFFHLTNQPATPPKEANIDDLHAKDMQPVEIAGIAEYLLSKSQPMNYDQPPEGYQPDAARGKDAFAKRGCLACHSHSAFPKATADFGPKLDKVHAKLKPDDSFSWLYTWIRNPQKYHKRSRMPNLYLEPFTPEGQDEVIDPAADIAAFLLEGGPKEFAPMAYEPAHLDALVNLYLKGTLTEAEREKTAKDQDYPGKAESIKGDEIELKYDPSTGEKDWDKMKLRYVGRRTISRYGCYACHDIPGFETAKPIGTALQDWGRKDPSKLAPEHIHEYLAHHGEPDGSSTEERVDLAFKKARSEQFKSDEQADREMSAAFYYESLIHHGRPGFLWQKLRAPRSYDHKKITTKGYDERLRMPKFPFSEAQIDAIATFVLGLTAEPPAEKYLYKPTGAAAARVEGEFLLQKYNCVSCHMIELPEIQFRIERPHTDDEDTKDIDESAPSTYGDYVTMTQSELVDLLVEFREPLSSKSLKDASAEVKAALDERLETVSGLLEEAATTDEKRRHLTRQQLLERKKNHVDALETIEELCTYFGLNTNIQGILATADAEADAALHKNLDEWFTNHPLVRLESPPDPKQALPGGVRKLLEFKSPQSGEFPQPAENGDAIVSFRGLVYGVPDLEEAPEDQIYVYKSWETLDVGGRILLPNSTINFTGDRLHAIHPSRGGHFASWLADHLTGGNPAPDVRNKAWQSSPPPLYLEGLKVQTPWLYHFLKNPSKLRYETVLRMPQFNMSDAEARALANYFAAADDTAFPYQAIPQREAAYLARKQTQTKALLGNEAPNYLSHSWEMFGKNALCITCHSVMGREFKAPDPKNVTHGPDLGPQTADRLRPDWLEVWFNNPAWITPYTGMPAPHGSPVKGYFKEDKPMQIDALRDAILNYNQLLQAEGKIDPPPPPKPTTTPPASE